MTTSLQSAWAWMLRQFEPGDLVPLIILVSAVHYAAILRGHDALPVAVAIGLLVDLGHYRWVRAAVRYKGANNRERAVRWALAAGMTALAVAYQQRYYADWTLSLPLPALVLSLAWLAEADKPAAVRKPSATDAEPVATPAHVPATVAEPAALLPAAPAPVALPQCPDCGRIFDGPHPDKQQSAHARYCPAKRKNGHHKPDKERIITHERR